MSNYNREPNGSLIDPKVYVFFVTLRFDFPRLEQDLTVALRRQRASEEGSMELVEG